DNADQELPEQPEVLLQIVGKLAEEWQKIIAKALGGDPTEKQREGVFTTLLRWVGKHSRIPASFRRASIVLQLKQKTPTLEQRRKGSLEALLSRQPEPIEVFTTVLFKGETLPGKDVAVLKCEKTGDFDVFDRAICLPLGDSDDLLPGARIQAMG